MIKTYWVITYAGQICGMTDVIGATTKAECIAKMMAWNKGASWKSLQAEGFKCEKFKFVRIRKP